ncbi:MAG: TolC family protein, partial [Phycisphaerales bacterium]|nr:TolC family protein [Phycisphaerales bacterium]
LTSWWDRFGDAELTRLVEQACDSSLVLEEARERIVGARARRGIRHADRLPTLDGQGSYTRSQTGSDGFTLGGAPAGSEIDVYSLGVVAGWEIDLWGRVGRLVQAADADIAIAIEDARAIRLSIASEVAREVILIRSIDRDVALIRAAIENDEDILAIATSRAEAGFGDDLEVARARRDLESNRALIPERAADRRDAEFRLAILSGVAPGTIAVSEAAMPPLQSVPARGVPADLLLRRPDLRRAERELAASTARLGATMAERYPRVSLSGSIALQGPSLDDTIRPESYVLSIGPSITLPIFEGGRIRSRIEEAASDERQAMLRLRASVIDALGEVESASQRHDRSVERVARLIASEGAAQEAESLATSRYAAGRIDFLDVTESRRSRLTIERTRVAAEREALLRYIDLATSLGGGWDSGEAQVVSGAG